MSTRRNKYRQPTSLRQAMEWCLAHARTQRNRSVDRVADAMGLSNKWVIYKWLESGRLPTVLIRPFEAACDAEYVTRYIAHSAHKLLIDIPAGRDMSAGDINALQASFTAAVALLIRFYEGGAEAEATAASLYETMEQLAWHRASVERHEAPELELFEETDQ